MIENPRIGDKVWTCAPTDKERESDAVQWTYPWEGVVARVDTFGSLVIANVKAVGAADRTAKALPNYLFGTESAAWLDMANRIDGDVSELQGLAMTARSRARAAQMPSSSALKAQSMPNEGTAR